MKREQARLALDDDGRVALGPKQLRELLQLGRKRVGLICEQRRRAHHEFSPVEPGDEGVERREPFLERCELQQGRRAADDARGDRALGQCGRAPPRAPERRLRGSSSVAHDEQGSTWFGRSCSSMAIRPGSYARDRKLAAAANALSLVEPRFGRAPPSATLVGRGVLGDAHLLKCRSPAAAAASACRQSVRRGGNSVSVGEGEPERGQHGDGHENL